MRIWFAFLLLTSFALGADDKPIREVKFLQQLARSMDRVKLSGTSYQKSEQFREWQTGFEDEFGIANVEFERIVEDVRYSDGWAVVAFKSLLDRKTFTAASVAEVRQEISLNITPEQAASIRKGQRFQYRSKLVWIDVSVYNGTHREQQYRVRRSFDAPSRACSLSGSFLALETVGDLSGIPIDLKASKIYRKDAAGELVPVFEWKKEKGE